MAGGSSACASGRRGARARASRSCRRGARRRSGRASRATRGNPHTDFRIEPDPELPVRDDLERRDFTVNAMARDVRTRRVDRSLRRARRPRRRRAARRAPDGVPRRPAAHPARRRRAAHRRPRARAGTLALMRAAAPRIAELSAERVRETLDQTLAGDGAADGAAAGPRCRRARGRAARVGALHRRATSTRATQAYTLDEHILHVLDSRRAATTRSRVLRLAAFWHDVGKPLAARPAQHAEEGARIAAPALCAAWPTTTTRVARSTASCASTPTTRIASRRRARARGFLARVGRERAPRSAAAAPLRPPRPRRARSRPSTRRGAERFEELVEQEWEQPVTRADLAVAATTCWPRGCPGARRSGRRCDGCSTPSSTTRRSTSARRCCGSRVSCSGIDRLASLRARRPRPDRDRAHRAGARAPALPRARLHRGRARLLRRKANPAQSYAARFAGKEAVGKALGCGVHFTWREIEIVGRPKPTVRSRAARWRSPSSAG